MAVREKVKSLQMAAHPGCACTLVLIVAASDQQKQSMHKFDIERYQQILHKSNLTL